MAAEKEHQDSFFSSMKPVLICGQVAGVFPLHGIYSSKHNRLYFSWCSWQFLYVGVLFFTTLFFNIVWLIDNISSEIRLDNFAANMFYSVCNLNTIFFVKIASKWPDISKKVYSVEKSMSEYKFPPFLGREIKLIIILYVGLAALEHGLLVYLNIVGTFEKMEINGSPFLYTFSHIRFDLIISSVPYHDFTVIFFFVVHVLATLNWSFIDFFLIVLFMEMRGKFKQFNARLSSLAHLKNDPSFWRKMCSDYNSLSILVKEFEKSISKLILMSYGSSLYHLSLQLIRSVKLRGSLGSKSYFYFSMGFLILRLLSVSICGAKLPEESKLARNTLYSMENHSDESNRLLQQINCDDLCFTGKRFFSIDRRFIFAMIGTLVTYEVILVQFNSLKES